MNKGNPPWPTENPELANEVHVHSEWWNVCEEVYSLVHISVSGQIQWLGRLLLPVNLIG